MMLVSDRGFGQWGEIFGNPIIATAILDRLLHHSVTINIKGESHRLQEKQEAEGPPASSGVSLMADANGGAACRFGSRESFRIKYSAE